MKILGEDVAFRVRLELTEGEIEMLHQLGKSDAVALSSSQIGSKWTVEQWKEFLKSIQNSTLGAVARMVNSRRTFMEAKIEITEN